MKKMKAAFTIDCEVAFEGIEVEIIVIKSPCFAFEGTKNNQSVVEPIS